MIRLIPNTQRRIGFTFRLAAGLLVAANGFAATPSSAQSAENQKPAAKSTGTVAVEQPDYYEISTEFGVMVIRLSNRTPLHRDNFRKLVGEKFFDGTKFHRVIDGFMIQGGDPLSKDDDPTNDGNGGPGYTIPAEFDSTLFHTYGAVAAARHPDYINPTKESNGSQFYIVQGRPFGEPQLYQMQVMKARQKPGFAYPDSVRAIYVESGGAPQLDGDYTVFGQLVDGFDVLAKISAVPTLRKNGANPNESGIDIPPMPIPMIVKALPNYKPSKRTAVPADSTEQQR